MFVGVVLGVHTAISTALVDRAGPLLPVIAYLQAATFVHFALLARSKLRGLPYRVLVSLPVSAYTAGTMLALPWAVVSPFVDLPGVFIPYAVAVVGLAQSLWARKERTLVALDRSDAGGLARGTVSGVRMDRPLRLVQISDPHLGPFMSERRLRRIAERAVAEKPDLVLLTGDLLTMESHRAPDALARALAPLTALEGKVFACRGNHDFEAPETIRYALESAKIPYLLDAEDIVETAAGPVQIIGLDYARRGRKEKMETVMARHPRREGVFRLVLLHDPGAFAELPDGEADLVLSGHTHGGQLGLVSLGLKGTFVSWFTKMPDHGLWAKGRNRLYVHRGTGHYGFPLRIGVPGEESVVEVHYDRGALSAGA
ncbi:MAG: phosphodiesterase [Polyangiaceae bacterium]|nr:phosphodiesterase [Polyangiaceae bacterium]